MPSHDDFVCPRCHTPLAKEASCLQCKQCATPYPILSNGLPVLVKESQKHIMQTVMAMKSEQLQRCNTLLKLKRFIHTAPSSRLSHLHELLQASEHNLQLLTSFINDLPNLPETDSIKMEPHSPGYHRFDTCLNYLYRDWSYQPNAEAEMATMTNRIIKLLQNHRQTKQTALVLGAGLGRVAHELEHMFKRVLAIDYSLFMGQLFQHIQQENVDFYQMKLKNTRTNQDQLKKVNISAPKPSVAYAIANASHLPVPSHTITAVISVYFTDVLPLSVLLPEVLRVLEPGGVFIHYGPLQYHFSDMQECYSAEALRAYFHDHGLVLLDEQWDQGQHVQGALFNNWSFLATIRSEQPS